MKQVFEPSSGLAASGGSADWVGVDPRGAVLVFEGGHALALVLVSVLRNEGIEVSVDDLPVGTGPGHAGSRIYVTRADEADARRVIAMTQRGNQRR